MNTKTSACFSVCFLLVALASRAQTPDSVRRYIFPKNEVYFQVAYLMPLGAFGTEFNPVTSVEETIQNGFGATGGFNIEAGEYFYFNRDTVEAAGGLKISYFSFDVVSFNWEKTGNYVTNGADYKNLNSISFKIGPCFRAVLAKDIAMRMYYQLCPTASYHASWSNELDYTESNQTYTYNINDQSSFALHNGSGIKNQAGVVVNYKQWMFGINVNFGKMKYKKVEFTRNVGVTERLTGNPGPANYESAGLGTSSEFSTTLTSSHIAFSFAYRIPLR